MFVLLDSLNWLIDSLPKLSPKEERFVSIGKRAINFGKKYLCFCGEQNPALTNNFPTVFARHNVLSTPSELIL
jgi:hypothetical protein